LLLKINPETPQERKIEQVVECLRNDGVIIYPTDTVYGIGCDIHSKHAIQRICQIKGVDPEKTNFSCICPDLKILGEYAVQVDTPAFKVMKRLLPGPYTFIVKASKHIPRHFQSKRKTVGIRIPDHNIPIQIVRELGNPIVTTSLRPDDEVLEYRTDAELIHERYNKLVDMVIDGGPGGTEPSTVVDISQGLEEMQVLREGKGELEPLEYA
jgi:tRNA threonylcarbamoyl adenosine modification protein (Sua5/YciO/YrdC/YwlC family)